MSKSFSVDLNDFQLMVPIAGGIRTLERQLDTLDLISVLMDEGFSDYVGYGTTYHRMHGYDLSSFREQVKAQTLGIPREATVDIRLLGRIRGKYLVTFHY